MSMLKNNYYYNIREEIFSAIVFDLVKGKRYYIDKKELANLYNNELLPSDICREKVDINRIKIIKIRPGEKKFFLSPILRLLKLLENAI